MRFDENTNCLSCEYSLKDKGGGMSCFSPEAIQLIRAKNPQKVKRDLVKKHGDDPIVFTPKKKLWKIMGYVDPEADLWIWPYHFDFIWLESCVFYKPKAETPTDQQTQHPSS